MKKLISILTVIFLSSCMLGPDYERANDITQQLEKFKNAPETQGEELISKWWLRLDDGISEELVAKLLSQNLSIDAAYARLKQSVAANTIAGADLYPTLSVELNGSRSKRPALSQSFSNGDAFNDFNLGLATSWQLDLFGKTRRELASSRANLEASIFEIDALIQSLIAQVIEKRIEIAIAQSRIELVESIVSSRENTLKIIDRRYKYGLDSVSALDVRLARENLSSAKAELPTAQAEYQNLIYELDLLLGQNVGKSDNLDYAKFELLPKPLNIKIPPAAALIDRRPDLQSSDLLLVAANEDIGVAMADLYPNLAISANFGTNARKFSQLLESDQIAWSVLGSLTQKLFAGGALRANVAVNEARKQELLADYKNDILTAVKEVETALLYEEKLQQRLSLLTDNLREAKNADRIANDRYTKGVGNILEVLETQRRLFTSAQNTLTAQEIYWKNRIALYLSLGGDWKFNKRDNNDKET